MEGNGSEAGKEEDETSCSAKLSRLQFADEQDALRTRGATGSPKDGGAGAAEGGLGEGISRQLHLPFPEVGPAWGLLPYSLLGAT